MRRGTTTRRRAGVRFRYLCRKNSKLTLEITPTNINTYEPTYVASNYDIEEEKLIVVVDGLYVDFARDVSFISKMIPRMCEKGKQAIAYHHATS